LGYADVDYMLDSMSCTQFQEWFDYSQIEPFGYSWDNFRFGLIPSAIYNTNRQKSSDKVWSPDDFFKKQKKFDNWEQHLNQVKAFCMLNNQKGE
jgi:hypothetical protein